MDFLAYRWYFPTGAFKPLPFGVDVKVRKNPTIRRHACQQRGFIENFLCKRHAPRYRSNISINVNVHHSRWYGFRSPLFSQTHEFFIFFFLLCVAFGFGWLQQDSTNSFGFVRCEMVAHVCVCVSVAALSHLVFRSCYSLLPWRRDLLDSIFLWCSCREIVCLRGNWWDCVPKIGGNWHKGSICVPTILCECWNVDGTFRLKNPNCCHHVCSATHYRFTWHHSFFFFTYFNGIRLNFRIKKKATQTNAIWPSYQNNITDWMSINQMVYANSKA